MKTRSILAALMVAALLVPACTKHRIPATHEHSGNTQTPGGSNNSGQGQGGSQNNNNTQDEFKLNMRSDWSISWERSWWDYVEADGSLSDVEVISLSCPGAAYFMVREFDNNWFKSEYNSDLKAYLQDEEKYLAQDVEYYGSIDNVWYVYNSSINELLLDRARSGERIYLLVGIKADGKLSGDYAQCVHMFEQERPSEEYDRWLGTWLVSNGRIGYDITISRSEANWLYWIDGWETGVSATEEQMNQESIEARFDRNTGNLVFFSQYIQSYYDENENLQLYEYFLGNVSDSSSEVLGITDTGLSIAVASFKEGSVTEGKLDPCKVSVRRDDGSSWNTEFTSMCYWNVDSDSEQPVWMRYNKSTPMFPLTMTFVPETKAAASAKEAPVREMSSLSVHKTQSRAHNLERGSTGVCYEGNRR